MGSIWICTNNFKEVNDPAFFDNVLGIVDYEARDEAIDRFIARKGQATYDRHT